MNKRILKKLCKRAAPLLPLLRDDRQQFPVSSEWPCESWSIRGMDRKSYDRWGGKINKHNYFCPLHGTIGVGGTSGYEEPEWEDTSAWQALKDIVFAECIVGPPFNWSKCKLDRRLDNPSQVFAAAAEKIAANRLL